MVASGSRTMMLVPDPAVPLVSINPAGSHDHPARDARALASGRLLPPEAATVFNRTQPKLAVYTHIVLQQTRTVPPPTIEEIVAETRRTYSGPLQAGEDLMSFDITDVGVKINPPPR
jgi:hypothetical protein